MSFMRCLVDFDCDHALGIRRNILTTASPQRGLSLLLRCLPGILHHAPTFRKRTIRHSNHRHHRNSKAPRSVPLPPTTFFISYLLNYSQGSNVPRLTLHVCRAPTMAQIPPPSLQHRTLHHLARPNQLLLLHPRRPPDLDPRHTLRHRWHSPLHAHHPFPRRMVHYA